MISNTKNLSRFNIKGGLGIQSAENNCQNQQLVSVNKNIKVHCTQTNILTVINLIIVIHCFCDNHFLLYKGLYLFDIFVLSFLRLSVQESLATS